VTASIGARLNTSDERFVWQTLKTCTYYTAAHVLVIEVNKEESVTVIFITLISMFLYIYVYVYNFDLNPGSELMRSD